MMTGRARGFSLVEVMLAIGVVAFAMIAIVALLPVGLGVAKSSRGEIQATSLIGSLAGDLRSTQATNTSTKFFGIEPNPWTTNASTGAAEVNPAIVADTDYTYYVSEDLRIVSDPQDAAFRINLKYSHFPSSPGGAIEAVLSASWPPSVDPAPSSGANSHEKVEVFLTIPPPRGL